MYNQQIKLIAIVKSVDGYGDVIEVHTEREIFAELKSVGQNEFYQAHAVGLKPELKFVIPDYLEYQNEKKLKYQAFNENEEKIYSIIRTFRNGNELEIICERGAE